MTNQEALDSPKPDNRQTLLDHPYIMEAALSGKPLFIQSAWEDAIDHLLDQGPVEYSNKFIRGPLQAKGKRHEYGTESWPLYDAMISGALDAYTRDHGVRKGTGVSDTTAGRVGKALAWGMLWPRQKDFFHVDMFTKDFDSEYENEALSFPGVAQLIAHARGVNAPHQFKLWQMAVNGLEGLVPAKDTRRQMSIELLSDILSVNARTNVKFLDSYPGAYQEELAYWLSTLSDSRVSLDVRTLGEEAVERFVYILSHYPHAFPPESPQRRNALLMTIEYYKHIRSEQSLSSLVSVIDDPDSHIAHSARRAIQEAFALGRHEMTDRISALSADPDESKRAFAASLVTFIVPGVTEPAPVLNSYARTFLEDPSPQVRRAMLCSIARLQGNYQISEQLWRTMRSYLMRGLEDEKDPRVLELYAVLPRMVQPVLAMDIMSQGLWTAEPWLHKKIGETLESWVRNWRAEGKFEHPHVADDMLNLVKRYAKQLGQNRVNVITSILDGAVSDHMQGFIDGTKFYNP